MAADVRFDPVSPDDLHGVWELVKRGLGSVLLKTGERWKPEDIYTAIKIGNASLHTCAIDNRYAGFIVTQKSLGFDGWELFVWAAYSREHNMQALCGPWVEEFGRSLKAKRIVFFSPRRAWERSDFVAKSVRYEKEL